MLPKNEMEIRKNLNYILFTAIIKLTMRNFLLIVSTLFLSLSVCGQEISGQWNGILNVQGTQLRLVFHIQKTEDGYSATMDSPDQNAKGIPVTSVSFDNLNLKISLLNLGIGYDGVLGDDHIVKGTFKQAGLSIPLNLSKEIVEKEIVVRPQEPKKPYPYYSEEVSFTNARDNITLSGTLTLPSSNGQFPVAVLISGSGPQNRDEELLGHKPFLILADHLTRKGIGVLRYDDRGTAQSTGDFSSANSKDFASDVRSAVAYLKTRNDIDKQQIGLIGHSEGGLIAPMVAAGSDDVAFIVLLAGTGISGYDILLLQTKLIGRANGKVDSELEEELEFLKGSLDLVLQNNGNEALKNSLRTYFQKGIDENPEHIPEGLNIETFINSNVEQLTSPWMQYFLKYDPVSNLKNVKCPVLAINGEKDLQVPPKVNLASIENSIKGGGNKNVTTKELANLNHLFQECTTGSPTEYGSIEQTFSPIALNEISGWILGQIK